MLLSKQAIANIQTRIDNCNYCFNAIKVRAIFADGSGTVARYTLNGVEVSSRLRPVQGDFISDLIVQAAMVNDYYVLDEIYRGIEKDEGIDLILKVWPANADKATNVVDMKPTVDKKPVVTQETIDQLSRRYERVQREHSQKRRYK